MEIKRRLVEALRSKYRADMELASAALQVYLERPAGIGEHPQILDEMDKLVESYDNAKDKLHSLEDGTLIDFP
jgi:hypothetical protein